MKSKPKDDGRRDRYIVRVFTLMLCLAVVFTASGCATSVAVSEGQDFGGIMQALKTDLFGAEERECSQISLVLPLREGFAPTEDKSAYDSLKDIALQEAYRDIEESLFFISSEKNDDGCYIMKSTRLSSELDSNEIYMVKEAVLADHPEIFWVTGDYEIGNNFHDGNYITLYSQYSYNEIVTALEEINDATEEVLSKIPDGASELERELIIHDALVDSISYDSEAASDDNTSIEAFGIYGALVGKKAVCSGYARAAKMLLNRVGIECRLVSGMSKNSGHMWNQVKIDGQWYNLDVTWDDPITNDDILYNRYSYFNITDEQLAVDHEAGEDFSNMTYEYTEDSHYVTAGLYNFDLEECSATEANYYMMNAVYISSMDENGISMITDKIKTVSKNKDEIFYLRFDESIASDAAETWLIKNSGSKSSALGKSLVAYNNSGAGSKIKTCSLVRLAASDEDVWAHVYAVRLVYG